MKKSLSLLFIAALLLSIIPLSGAASAEGQTVRVGWVLREGMTELDGDVYSGYNYDYLMELSNYTGWEYEFVTGEADEITEMLQRGEIDLQGSLLYSEERSRLLDYPELPAGNKYTILFARERSELQEYDFDSFDGLRVGYLSSDEESSLSLSDFADDCGFSVIPVACDSSESLYTAVADGAVDAGVVDIFLSEPGFRVLAEFSPVPYYFATTAGNDEILHELNRAQWQLNLERPYIERELYDRHFGISFDPELTPEERALAEASKSEPVKIGVIPDYAPLCYYNDETGCYEGIIIEILNTVSENTGLQMEYVWIDMLKGSPPEQIKTGSQKLVAGILKTAGNMSDEALAISDDLATDSLVMVGRHGDDFTRSPESKTIAVMRSFIMARQYIAEQFPEHQLAYYDTIEQCLAAVMSGEADATPYLRSCMNFKLQNPHYSSLEVILAYSANVSLGLAGSADSSSELVSIINKGLGMISENERSKTVMNFTVMNPYHMTISDVMYKYRAFILLITLLALAVIGVLTSLIIFRRRANRRLRTALSDAQQASTAKGEFMSRMSHEIRTPLNAITGFNTIARAAIDNARTDEQRRQADMCALDCLTKSELASKHLLTVINDVLDMSAIESGKIRLARDPFDFKTLIGTLTVLFYSQAKSKNVDFEVLFDSPTEEWFVGDHMRISQILTNLLSNAVKFTPEGGRVTLSVTPGVADDEHMSFRFDVSDIGIGMSREFLERLWQPFEQADSSISRRFGGTGLGLAITKSLVDIMGGSISARSEQGVGSTFSVELTVERMAQPEKPVAYDFSGINALIVDTDQSTCDYIRLLFDRCGARCETAGSEAEALSAFKKAIDRGDRFTLCLVDWSSPDESGVETVKKLRELAGSETPIIIVTAYDYSEIAEQVKLAGVTMFLAKPLFQSSLFDLFATISGEQRPQKIEKSGTTDFSGARVLLAEDNKMNMEVAQRILQSTGLEVVGAWNGRQAVELFEASEPGSFCAILMDVHMPEMNGYDATRAIRESSHPEAASIPIIAMTADAFAENVAEAYASGMNDHIAKPIDIPTLFATLKKYIG